MCMVVFALLVVLMIVIGLGCLAARRGPAALRLARSLGKEHPAGREMPREGAGQCLLGLLTGSLAIRMVLALGIFFTMVGMTMFVFHRRESFSPTIKPVILAMATAAFYLGGKALERSRRLEGLALMTIGCLGAALDLAALQNFVLHRDPALYGAIACTVLTILYGATALWVRAERFAVLACCAAFWAGCSSLAMTELPSECWSPVLLLGCAGALALAWQLKGRAVVFHRPTRAFVHVAVPLLCLGAGLLGVAEHALAQSVPARQMTWIPHFPPLFWSAATLILAAGIYVIEKKRTARREFAYPVTAALTLAWTFLAGCYCPHARAWALAIFAGGLMELGLSFLETAYRTPLTEAGLILLAAATTAAWFDGTALSTGFLFADAIICTMAAALSERKAWIYAALSLALLIPWPLTTKTPYAGPYLYTLAAVFLLAMGRAAERSRMEWYQVSYYMGGAAMAISSVLALRTGMEAIACCYIAHDVLLAALAFLRDAEVLFLPSAGLGALGLIALENLWGLTWPQMALSLLALGCAYWFAGALSEVGVFMIGGIITAAAGTGLGMLTGPTHAQCIYWFVTGTLFIMQAAMAARSWHRPDFAMIRVQGLAGSILYLVATLLLLHWLGIQEKQAYVLSIAGYLLLLRHSQRIDGWTRLPPPWADLTAFALGVAALAVACTTSFVQSLGPGGGPYAILLAVEALAALFYGVRARLLSFFLGGALALAMDGGAQLWRWLYPLPRWALITGVGLALLALGIVAGRGREKLRDRAASVQEKLKSWQL